MENTKRKIDKIDSCIKETDRGKEAFPRISHQARVRFNFDDGEQKEFILRDLYGWDFYPYDPNKFNDKAVIIYNVKIDDYISKLEKQLRKCGMDKEKIVKELNRYVKQGLVGGEYEEFIKYLLGKYSVELSENSIKENNKGFINYLLRKVTIRKKKRKYSLIENLTTNIERSFPDDLRSFIEVIGEVLGKDRIYSSISYSLGNYLCNVHLSLPPTIGVYWEVERGELIKYDGKRKEYIIEREKPKPVFRPFGS